MSQEQIGTTSNPLKKYYRQPKQFVKLPSGYKFYPEGSIEVPESGEVAVYPMTAKDEMLLKTPDALLNGEATVSVIQSCIPAIKNAWAMPSIDCDAALMTIRMATYGNNMNVPITVPGTKIKKDLVLDLQESLSTILSAQYNDTFFYQNMEVKTKPLTYKEFTESAIQTFEQQRIQKIVDDTKMNDEEKNEFLMDLKLEESGLNRLIRKGFDLLGLLTFFTVGPKEARAWTLRKESTAPEAAGTIHTDFQKGFIRAETISYDDYLTYKSEQAVKDSGRMRVEGSDYIVQDGDIFHFRFNV